MASRLGAEIVSVDSMAVYRRLDIGTAKPTAAERERVPHHLVDVVDPGKTFSVADWLSSARAAVDAIRATGRRVLFVGGTPLYLRGLREGLAPLPSRDEAIRDELEAEADRSGPESLHRRLAVADPASAARIHPRDTRRLVRALEILAVSGSSRTAAFGPVVDPWFDERLLVIDLPRRVLRARIDARVATMFASGLVEEARCVAADGGIGPTAMQAAGYAEALAVAQGRLDPAAAIEATRRRTRQLAKRQLTWLRSFRRAIWVTA
jgi:tRNA dimethylallyltransferase